MRAPDGPRSGPGPVPARPAGERPQDPAGRPGGVAERVDGRGSLRVTLLLLLVGVLLVVLGAGRSWAGLQAAVSVPSLGSTRVGSTNLTGNDLAPLSGLALLGLVLVVGIAVTRGHGRWLVGVALLALAVTLLVQTSAAAARARSEAERRARQGEVVGVPAGGDLRVSSPRSGPVLALAGGALLVLAGAETRRVREHDQAGAAIAEPDAARGVVHEPRAVPGQARVATAGARAVGADRGDRGRRRTGRLPHGRVPR